MWAHVQLKLTERSALASSSSGEASGSQQRVELNKSQAAKDEATLRYLIAQRDGISKAEHQLDVRINHSDGAALLLSAAYHELELEQSFLAQADEFEKEDLLEQGRQDARMLAEAMGEYETQDALGTLANLTALAADEPAFKTRMAAPNAAVIRQLISGPTWTAGDTDKLRQITLAECKSVLAHRMLRDHDADETIQKIEAMSDAELAEASLPPLLRRDHRPMKDPRDQGSRAGEAVDWNVVAQIVGRHSADDCRTHWLMHARPGVNDAAWSAAEIEKVVELVEAAKARGDDPVLWENIAVEHGQGRTGYACLATYRRKTATRDASTWTEDDTTEMVDLVSIYGPQWSQVATSMTRPHTAATIGKQFAKLQNAKVKR
ncbi:hypothetical protein V8E36_008411 [Tilletia maclaganii]